MFKTKEELLMAIMKCLPYPDQISDLDMTTEPEAIRLTWRKGHSFNIPLTGHVYERLDGCLSGSDIAILFRELLKRQHISDYINS